MILPAALLQGAAHEEIEAKLRKFYMPDINNICEQCNWELHACEGPSAWTERGQAYQAWAAVDDCIADARSACQGWGRRQSHLHNN